MKKILISVMVIAVAVGLVASASGAFFSDTETSLGNIMTAGTVDIAVDNLNPWTGTFDGDLSDMKPCQTKLTTLTINNVGANPVKVWKHLEITDQNGGAATFPVGAAVASSEPEWTEGGGAGYVERCNLASFIVYDLSVDGNVFIDEAQQVRLDNVACNWIYLGEIAVGDSMEVEQSYHLMGWDDSGQEITNWAQGDVVEFYIEFYAEQVSGPGPIASSGTLNLVEKDPVTWVEVSGDSGVVTYSFVGSDLTCSFTGTVPLASTEYSLIYYPDPWPGTGLLVFGTGTSDGSGNLAIAGGTQAVPVAGDNNTPAGVKIWVVSSSDVGTTQMTVWSPGDYLFEEHLLATP